MTLEIKEIDVPVTGSAGRSRTDLDLCVRCEPPNGYTLCLCPCAQGHRRIVYCSISVVDNGLLNIVEMGRVNL